MISTGAESIIAQKIPANVSLEIGHLSLYRRNRIFPRPNRYSFQKCWFTEMQVKENFIKEDFFFITELCRQTSTTSPLSSPEQNSIYRLPRISDNGGNGSPLSIAVSGFDDAPMTSSPLRRYCPVRDHPYRTSA